MADKTEDKGKEKKDSLFQTHQKDGQEWELLLEAPHHFFYIFSWSDGVSVEQHQDIAVRQGGTICQREEEAKYGDHGRC